MKHWDLKPGEIVTLKRGADEHAPTDPSAVTGPNRVIARFLFHTTRLAVFEQIRTDPKAPVKLIQFEARDDGGLRDLNCSGMVCNWHVVGEDRHTRMVAREPLGQKANYTMTDRSVQRAIAKGATS